MERAAFSPMMTGFSLLEARLQESDEILKRLDGRSRNDFGLLLAISLRASLTGFDMRPRRRRGARLKNLSWCWS